MGVFDVLSWVVGGLITGSLIDSISPIMARGARLATASAALVASVLGGAAVAVLTGISTVAFLGAVCAAVLGGAALAYLLRRGGVRRYHG